MAALAEANSQRCALLKKSRQNYLGGNQKYFFHEVKFSVLPFVHPFRVKLPFGSETVAAATSTLLSVSDSPSSVVFKGISRHSLPNSVVTARQADWQRNCKTDGKCSRLEGRQDGRLRLKSFNLSRGAAFAISILPCELNCIKYLCTLARRHACTCQWINFLLSTDIIVFFVAYKRGSLRAPVMEETAREIGSLPAQPCLVP